MAGSRNRDGAAIVVAQNRARRWLGRGFLALSRLLCDRSATDITCGFKGFRRPAAAAVFGRSRVDGWAFDAEIALIARRLGLVRRELPVAWRHDPDSRVRVLLAVPKSLLELLCIAWRDWRGKYAATPEERAAARSRERTT